MIRVHPSRRNGVGPFHYFILEWYLSKSLSSDPNGDRMQKLHQWEFDIPSYHFEVQNIVGVSYYREMSRVHFIERNGVAHLHYFSPWWDLSNGLSSDPNEDSMQIVFPGEVDERT